MTMGDHVTSAEWSEISDLLNVNFGPTEHEDNDHSEGNCNTDDQRDEIRDFPVIQMMDLEKRFLDYQALLAIVLVSLVGISALASILGYVVTQSEALEKMAYSALTGLFGLAGPVAAFYFCSHQNRNRATGARPWTD